MRRKNIKIRTPLLTQKTITENGMYHDEKQLQVVRLPLSRLNNYKNYMTTSSPNIPPGKNIPGPSPMKPHPPTKICPHKSKKMKEKKTFLTCSQGNSAQARTEMFEWEDCTCTGVQGQGSRFCRTCSSTICK